MSMVLLMTSKIYSQKAIIEKPGDTLICFSVPQSKFLLKEYYRLQMIDSLLYVCEEQKLVYDANLKTCNRLSFKYEKQFENCSQYQKIQEHEIIRLNKLVDEQEKTIIREKRNQKILLVCSGLLTGFFGYLALTN